MTHSRWPGGRLARVLAAALMVAGTITAFGLARAVAAPAAGCRNWTGAQPPNPGGASNTLSSVAIESACDAWAVGASFTTSAARTLTLHWNGTQWTRVPTPDPGGDPGGPAVPNDLNAVAGTSASDTWAVGSSGAETLILHWNGPAWTHVPSPAPGTNAQLFAVAASSASNMWAAGIFSDGTSDHTLAVHCC